MLTWFGDADGKSLENCNFPPEVGVKKYLLLPSQPTAPGITNFFEFAVSPSGFFECNMKIKRRLDTPRDAI